MHAEIETIEESFTPSFWLRNHHVQSILASSRFRKKGAEEIRNRSREIIVSGGNGVRLQCLHSAPLNTVSKGMIILIHGWEGSSDSAYMISASRFFIAIGYDILRLNLRDHGHSHHLNAGLFHGALIDETFAAVSNIVKMFEKLPCYLIGFSIGGNFALRIALRYSSSSMPNLKHIFSVSPPLDPLKSTIAIDQVSVFYRRYFVKKWKKSLRIKQRLYPELYDFSRILKMDNCMDMTEAIMAYYPEFSDYREYFSRYTLRGGIFHDLAIPLSVIISADDPVVPVEDFLTLRGNELFSLSMQRYGGHCGFFETFPIKSWHEKKILEVIDQD